MQQPLCSWCGKRHSKGRDHCPARVAVCHRCKKRGHFQAVCRSRPKTLGTIEQEEAAFMGVINGTVAAVNTSRDAWTATISLKGTSVDFKLDTGADVTAIPLNTFNSLADVKLMKSDRILKGPDQAALKVKGKFMTDFKWQQKSSREEIYVMEKLQKPLIGRPAIERLGLLVRVEEIQDSCLKKYQQMYPTVFTGLGKMSDEYCIKLNPQSTPFSIAAPRRIPYLLRSKVKAELKRMEELGVISKITKPTSWCAGIVVVLKSNGHVRICVDLTKLNESVCREKYQLPSVEESLSKLSRAHVFTKLDANSGFWQIPLHSDSRPLTTFLTPFGRYCFNRLPFGITSALEHFQH